MIKHRDKEYSMRKYDERARDVSRSGAHTDAAADDDDTAIEPWGADLQRHR